MNVANNSPNESKQVLRLPKQLTVDGATYEWAKFLGKGGYAVALSAKRVDPNRRASASQEMVAIKAVSKNNFNKGKINDTVVQYAMREIHIMNQLNHDNVVKLHSHWQDESFVYLVMELCVNKVS